MEKWFAFGWEQFLVLTMLLLVYLLLVFTNKLPSVGSFKDVADTINTAGGHIIILTLFSAWFFEVAMRFIFHVINLPDDIVTKRDAEIMTGMGFVTGTAFGGAWGALLKTMSGGKANGVAATDLTISKETPTPPKPGA
jgi:hypothetical protein